MINHDQFVKSPLAVGAVPGLLQYVVRTEPRTGRPACEDVMCMRPAVMLLTDAPGGLARKEFVFGFVFVLDNGTSPASRWIQ